MKITPKFDQAFKPIYPSFKGFQERATEPLSICIERNDGLNYVFNMRITGDNDESKLFAERITKALLWTVGGFRIYILGREAIYRHIKAAYCSSGARSFDAGFMSNIYNMPFEVINCSDKTFPKEKADTLPAGGNVSGYRIGFDAGGSDRKVSAVINGEVVYSEEVVWHPKTTIDPAYHYEGIVSALKTAASKMPRVDAIGVSSAGIYINNLTCAASLFMSVPKEDFHQVRDIYVRAAREIGDVPLRVANDGDVTAIAGAISLGSNRVLGIAMGTSEAGGYVNAEGGLNGWLTELAFVPCDLNPEAEQDPWSGDIGTGVSYFSQDGIIKLAKLAGVSLDEGLSPAEKLKVVQALMEEGDERARGIYQSVGAYLGHTLPFYAMLYDIEYVLVLGRVLSGKGGDLIVEVAKDVIKEEYPHLNIKIVTPDEKFKRVGQSIAAASLPKL